MEPEQVRNIMDSMIGKLYDMELEELGRSGWQNEKLLSEVRKLLEKNKASIQVEDKTGREGVDLAFAIAEIGEEIGFTQALASKLAWHYRLETNLVLGIMPSTIFESVKLFL